MHSRRLASARSFLVPLCPQKCIDWNREVLKRELGLTEGDIIDVPQLFSLKGPYADAFFPDMVRRGGAAPGPGFPWRCAPAGQTAETGERPAASPGVFDAVFLCRWRTFPSSWQV